MSIIDTILGLFGIKKPTVSDLVPGGGDAPDVAGAAAEAAGIEDSDSDDDDDDDDDEGRDYDLEEKDDSASFDFENDLKGFYVAQFQVEQAWEDTEDRDKLFAQYAIRNTQHWYQVTATHDRYIQSPGARAKYGDQGDIMQIKMNATMEHAHGGIRAGLDGALKGEVEPVEGVTLEQWAQIQAKIAGGGDANALVAAAGIDKPKWDRVSAEWNARMSRDTTGAIAMEYSKHFSSAGAGQFAGAAAAGAAAMASGGEVDRKDAPIPLEKYVEIEQAQAAGSAQGKDAAAVLKSFGMTPLDWSNVGQWWSQFITRNAMKNNAALHKEYTALQEKYEAKYKAGSADGDISF